MIKHDSTPDEVLKHMPKELIKRYVDEFRQSINMDKPYRPSMSKKLLIQYWGEHIPTTSIMQYKREFLEAKAAKKAAKPKVVREKKPKAEKVKATPAKKKVIMKQAAESLEARKAKAATKIQSAFRAMKSKKELAEKKEAAIKLQSAFRAMKARKEYAKKVENKLNNFLPTSKFEKNYKTEAAIKMQSAFRAMKARKEYAKKVENKLNNLLPTSKFEKNYKTEAAIKMQSAFRAMKARKQLNDLKKQIVPVKTNKKKPEANDKIKLNLASKNPYEFLGFKSKVSDEEVKKRYKKLAILYHPDKSPDADPEIFIKIQSAYENIISKEADEKKEYDISEAKNVNDIIDVVNKIYEKVDAIYKKIVIRAKILIKNKIEFTNDEDMIVMINVLNDYYNILEALKIEPNFKKFVDDEVNKYKNVQKTSKEKTRATKIDNYLSPISSALGRLGRQVSDGKMPGKFDFKPIPKIK